MSFPDSKTDSIGGLQAPRKQEIILCRRSLQLVGRITPYAREASVVIAMPLHNQAKTLRVALESALAQKLSTGHCAVVLMDDQSTDHWQQEVQDILNHPAVIFLEAHCGNAALARNAILDFIESELPSVKWVARLDSDDLLCSKDSVECLRSAGENQSASFVIGSNSLAQNGVPIYPDNIAKPDLLLDRGRLTEFIEEFCQGRAKNELPSCNLLIRSGRGIRYPLLQSAEDHWLVAQLLMFRSEHAAVVPYPIYSRYTLKGTTTTSNQLNGIHQRTREFLARAAKVWYAASTDTGEILGNGLEGCVLKIDKLVVKRFYPGIMTSEVMERLAGYARKLKGRLPIFEWSTDEVNSISCRYEWSPLDLIGSHVSVKELQSFLLDFARAGIVVCNIKRENLRLQEGQLIYIDIGTDIREFSPSYFMDSAARLYAIGVLNLPDGELGRRQSYLKQHESMSQLEGFDDFYRDLVIQLYPLVQLPLSARLVPCPSSDVTLMIKACPQDHASFVEQVAHIVAQLSRPRTFAKIVIAIDPHVGSYLRQYADGNLQALLESAEKLRAGGIVDAVLTSPQEPVQIENLFLRWFDISGIRATHTHDGAPVFAQLWAFEQVSTRYVLQCDLDVLIGRKDCTHDYLTEMLTAIQQEQTWCVGFNIPKRNAGFSPYVSTPLGFVPEIRLGLLDLQKIQGRLPLPNTSFQGYIVKMWHRSMEDAQRATGMQSVRGGDDRTFYVHPLNEIKETLDIELVRDLIGQGRYPLLQAEKWDLIFDAPWLYPRREECIVFLLKGRNTPKKKLQRCLASLQAQTDQDFGVILIDDASEPLFSWTLDEYLGSLSDRTTLVRRRTHKGYIPNFLLASQLCLSEDALIAVLDQDDVLMTRDVVTSLKQARDEGVDLVHGLMFRPNKPTRFYLTDYKNPREKGGGNTWTHLRAFTKKLFDSVPTDQYMMDGDWITDVSDYATMLPMVELAKNPLQMTDQYHVWHDRHGYPTARKIEQARLITALLARPGLHRSHDLNAKKASESVAAESKVANKLP